MGKRMFGLAENKLALTTQTGLGNQVEFDTKVDEFVRMFGFERGELERELVNL
jgi:hypothetical protein